MGKEENMILISGALWGHCMETLIITREIEIIHCKNRIIF